VALFLLILASEQASVDTEQNEDSFVYREREEAMEIVSDMDRGRISGRIDWELASLYVHDSSIALGEKSIIIFRDRHTLIKMLNSNSVKPIPHTSPHLLRSKAGISTSTQHIFRCLNRFLVIMIKFFAVGGVTQTLPS
jgi:hypothetical protein